MKPKTQRIYELKGDLRGYKQVICVNKDEVYHEFINWIFGTKRKNGDVLTIMVDEMTKKEISQLEEY